MNDIIQIIIMDWISNLTSNPFKMGFVPYTGMLGNWFFAMFFGFIGGAVYIGTGNKGALLTYLMLVGIFMTLVLPFLILTIFGLIVGFIIASILYYAFIQKESV